MSYLYKNTFETPIGTMTSLVAENGIYLLQFADSLKPKQIERVQKQYQRKIIEKDHSMNLKVEQELCEYLGGTRTEFTIPTIMNGTVFQTKVWQALKNIPYGTTLDYQGLGKEIGYPNASRAIGNANSSNLIMILIPCHRVIRSDGSIGGYAGGVSRKRYLLTLEENDIVSKNRYL
ncbi:methylated-DNA--[protein]-cysteine S-methyltransferase [Globicatella sanguinis]